VPTGILAADLVPIRQRSTPTDHVRGMSNTIREMPVARPAPLDVQAVEREGLILMPEAEQLEQDAMHSVVTRLVSTYAQSHSAQDVRATVADIYQRLDDSRIRTYIPLLVENGARQLLREGSRPSGGD